MTERRLLKLRTGSRPLRPLLASFSAASECSVLLTLLGASSSFVVVVAAGHRPGLLLSLRKNALKPSATHSWIDRPHGMLVLKRERSLHRRGFLDAFNKNVLRRLLLSPDSGDEEQHVVVV